ncbi:hypothetical protein EG68_07987 [Paragonimus skrjabini miyazakii]|uniref:Uncharacterized protein n=1 Tax=Paragonimus skrjabini miyazakii TaxID=59628 RepID=A0A8S9YJW3_9TREM|nr:hypothetical protein EG68_07987 [Paragonimus skrjabini miyazakii]
MLFRNYSLVAYDVILEAVLTVVCKHSVRKPFGRINDTEDNFPTVAETPTPGECCPPVSPHHPRVGLQVLRTTSGKQPACMLHLRRSFTICLTSLHSEQLGINEPPLSDSYSVPSCQNSRQHTG